ncbi:MAG: MotA/TolQ/ExbB proton channel family protein [Chlorobiota bacterium]|nr:MotA/TolQ/ExbB proton channel family protein [Chlorobiota bacterium]QQS66469.1 MAG: MotA/TolQ/ExbB proton channel family protein [Chlorobiota bacterium]
MKKYFVPLVILGCVIIGFLIFNIVFGNASHFNDALKKEPKDLMGTVYTGGPLVAILLSLILMMVTFIIERIFSLTKAAGSKRTEVFVHEVDKLVEKGDLKGAMAACDSQKGSAASVIRAGLDRYEQLQSSPLDADKKLAEVKRSIDETMGLETPMLEKNLIVLSTVASTSTMIGLLGTTIGMIRAFQALATAGQAASATQLSIGISEALINTAGGLIAAIISIVGYNFFTTKVDGMVYGIEEGVQQLMETLAMKTK